MADITEAAMVKFSNEHVRPMARAHAELYAVASRFLLEAGTKGIMSKGYADDDVIVGDGAPDDGRPTVTYGEIRAIHALALAVKTDLEANGSADLNTLLGVYNVPLIGD